MFKLICDLLNWSGNSLASAADIKPLDLILKYGADGVRVGMLLCSPAGNDLMFDESYCEQGRNFANKIWKINKRAGIDLADDTNPLGCQVLIR